MKNKNVITQATDWDAIEFSLDYNVLPFNKKWSKFNAAQKKYLKNYIGEAYPEGITIEDLHDYIYDASDDILVSAGLMEKDKVWQAKWENEYIYAYTESNVRLKRFNIWELEYEGIDGILKDPDATLQDLVDWINDIPSADPDDEVPIWFATEAEAEEYLKEEEAE